MNDFKNYTLWERFVAAFMNRHPRDMYGKSGCIATPNMSDTISKLREDGKLHILIIQGSKFISEDHEASDDFVNDANQMIDAAAVCLWRRGVQPE
jgi:hypothetical protein